MELGFIGDEPRVLSSRREVVLVRNGPVRAVLAEISWPHCDWLEDRAAQVANDRKAD